MNACKMYERIPDFLRTDGVNVRIGSVSECQRRGAVYQQKTGVLHDHVQINVLVRCVSDGRQQYDEIIGRTVHAIDQIK